MMARSKGQARKSLVRPINVRVMAAMSKWWHEGFLQKHYDKTYKGSSSEEENDDDEVNDEESSEEEADNCPPPPKKKSKGESKKKKKVQVCQSNGLTAICLVVRL
ncbi:hypothetical protein RHMOL_Rhmol05G0147600 [Rhododendron molle]|uniref:Uncharacterized protein n=1 Tax=Rhododendron molle TaxID=49168 RepID=A0ACC0NQD1_RHOML|nr:hypothetical protein RHMOL_Rhmol05G0147600 [Rhododendron molle]